MEETTVELELLLAVLDLQILLMANSQGQELQITCSVHMHPYTTMVLEHRGTNALLIVAK
jgi:hypothetical protein